MVSHTRASNQRNSSISSMPSSSLSSRSLLAKEIRRFIRTTTTRCKRFFSRPPSNTSILLILLFVSILFIIFFLVLPLYHFIHPNLVYREPRREETHFNHKVHQFLPRPADFETVSTRPCSWLYLEFGAKDGRFLDSFFENGNSFLEEYLRATQSAMRAFCSIAFDPNPALHTNLMQIRKLRAKKASHFNVFTQFIPSISNQTEQIKLKSIDDPSNQQTIQVQTIPLAQFIKQITFPWHKSGNDIKQMSTSIGNGNKGNVIIRLNINDIREAYMYLDNLSANVHDGIMCQRIDRLILNFKKIRLDPNKMTGDIEDTDIIRDWDSISYKPSSNEFLPSNGFQGIVEIADQVNELSECRTTIHVLNYEGKMIVPKILSERQIFYAILAGQPTFDERINAQTDTWMTAVPNDRITIFTNLPRDKEELRAARGRETIIVQPNRPQLEKNLKLMQSWSHLVRLRESWDRVMKGNPEIKWLALVDDDTFVFPGGLREYLSKFDNRIALWGGSGEQARVDNGDSGKFANWLRNTNKAHGGKHCYFENEDIPESMKGVKIEYARSQILNNKKIMRRVSHMCKDTFCRRGCPAVPQGAAIMVSRAMVEAVRPHVEECESDTSSLCENCGSQRLYMCVNQYIKGARTLLTRGICRAPWKLEHRENFPFVLTFHGFNRYHGRYLSTRSLHGDMEELWQLGKLVESRVRANLRDSLLVSMQSIADMIGCHGQGKYIKGKCSAIDGIETKAMDGKDAFKDAQAGHQPSDRKGSA